MLIKIQKTRATDNNFGHYGRNAMLVGSTSATWGVFRDGEQIAQIKQETDGRYSGGAWNVENPHTYKRIVRRGFQSAKQAKAWALEHLQDGVEAYEKNRKPSHRAAVSARMSADVAR